MPAPTPYNSIYSTMGPPSNAMSPFERKKASCCQHGISCPLTREDSPAYVNLLPQEEEETTRQQVDEEQLRHIIQCIQAVQVGEKTSKKAQKDRAKMRKKRRENGIKSIDTTSRNEVKKTLSNRCSHQKKKEKPFDTVENLASVVKPKSEEEEEKTIKKVYIGVKNWTEAEAELSHPTEFRIYHRLAKMTLAELEPILPLFVVYKAANGKYKHYRIREQIISDQKMYFVEYGDMRAVGHPSLNHLVRFYQTQFFSHQSSEGEQRYDAFP